MPPSHISTAWRMMRMSRSAVGDAGTMISTSTCGESSPFMPVRMW